MSKDQEETIAFLERPDSYGPGVPEVQRLDTHASVVFLAGARAYKLKRAIRYSYLDYSTPELRRIACVRELELNRRTAPELYLRVAPITRGEAGLAIGGDGAAVDWLVDMVRFDQERLFSRMAEEGHLSERHIRDLADHIATFHDGAEVDRRSGGAAAIAKVIQGNDENLRVHAGAFDPKDIEALRSASQRALAALADLLDRRRDEGHVRLCHGDLHLRNICLFDGRPTLFDCVEFSEELHRIDVLYDLAFLVMDLHQRGLFAHANHVLNRYLDLREEADGLAALPLFLSLRAAIRAHTGAAAILRQQDPDRAARMRSDNPGYLAAAIAFLNVRPARLIAIGGLSGTGKTSLAHALAPELGRAPGARVLRSDVLRKRLVGVAPETRLGPDAYTPETSERVYRTLCMQAAAALRGGQAVIVDAAFLREEERSAIAEVGRAGGVPFDGLWLEAPMPTLESRIQARRDDASDATVAVLRREPQLQTGRIEWLRLNASPDEPERVARMARSVIADGDGAPE
jgi:aminoglycoside phosphotransferase family enzyme/predicted kinase